MTGYTEKVILIDQARTLVGIMTEPDDRETASGRPAVVILNTGIIHRVGHNRMFVTFARDMAAVGIAVLRFDLSGLGDSANRHGARAPLLANMEDIREAVDWLVAGRGYPGAILMGLCSGADQSIVYAGSDPRVSGVVLLDPTIPQTPRHLRLTQPRRRWWQVGPDHVLGDVLRSILRAVRKLRGVEAKPVVDDGIVAVTAGIGIDRPEVRAYIESAYRRAVDNRIPMLAILTAGLPHQHSYREQLTDAFDTIAFGEHLSVEYLDRVDHTFTAEADRRIAFARIRDWLVSTQFRSVERSVAASPLPTPPTFATGS